MGSTEKRLVCGSPCLEGLILNVLLPLALFSALDEHWAGLPVWILPWVLLFWYLVRFVQAWRHGELRHFLYLHVVALVPVTLASLLVTPLVILQFVGMFNGVADPFSGFIAIGLLAVVGMFLFFLLLPLVIWLVKRWLPGRPDFAHAWRDTMLGLLGLSLVSMMPIELLSAVDSWLAKQASPPPAPEVVVHPAADTPGLRWVLWVPEEADQQNHFAIMACRPTDGFRVGKLFQVTDCVLVDGGELLTEGGGASRVFRPERIRMALKDATRVICMHERQGMSSETGLCHRAVFAPAPDRESSTNMPTEGYLLLWGLLIEFPRPSAGVLSEASLELCLPQWLPEQREQCMVIDGTSLDPRHPARRGLFHNTDQLFHPTDPRMRDLPADSGYRLYLHLRILREGDIIGIGARYAIEHDDYYPVTLPPIPVLAPAREGAEGKS